MMVESGQSRTFVLGEHICPPDDVSVTEKIFGKGARIIGDPLPEMDLIELSETHPGEFVGYQNAPPLSDKWSQLVCPLGCQRPHIKLENVIREIQSPYYLGLASWMAIRYIGFPEYKLIGPEAYFIGKFNNNPTHIARYLAGVGLTLKGNKLYPDIYEGLGQGMFNNLELPKLDIIDGIIHGSITQWRQIMTREASDFQRETKNAVEQIPFSLRKIFFALDTDNRLQQFLLFPRREMHPALGKPDLPELTFEEQEAYDRIGRLFRGTHPFARYFMRPSVEPSL